MAKLHYTGQAEAPVTFQNKYSVETDAVIEVDDQDVDALLSTGRFEKVGSSGSSGSSGSGKSKKSDSAATNDNTGATTPNPDGTENQPGAGEVVPLDPAGPGPVAPITGDDSNNTNSDQNSKKS